MAYQSNQSRTLVNQGCHATFTWHSISFYPWHVACKVMLDKHCHLEASGCKQANACGFTHVI